MEWPKRPLSRIVFLFSFFFGQPISPQVQPSIWTPKHTQFGTFKTFLCSWELTNEKVCKLSLRDQMRSGYLAYLSSGNVDEMYRVMWECGKLTREDLGKMCGLEAIQPEVGPGLAFVDKMADTSIYIFGAIAYLFIQCFYKFYTLGPPLQLLHASAGKLKDSRSPLSIICYFRQTFAQMLSTRDWSKSNWHTSACYLPSCLPSFSWSELVNISFSLNMEYLNIVQHPLNKYVQISSWI